MKFQKKLALYGVSLLGLPLMLNPVTHAAKPINLNHQSISALHSLISGNTGIKETSRSVDFNNTLHVRIAETYLGYPVLGADAVLHLPNGSKTAASMNAVLTAAAQTASSMNGTLYTNINQDLANTPAIVFDQTQAQNALAHAIELYQHESSQAAIVKDKNSRLIVFIDADNKAHWAYQVSFYVEPAQANTLPAKPVYILDATSFKVYQQWNNIQTQSKENETNPVEGGGFGGNKKMGKMIYDGLGDDLPKLNITRDDKNICSLKNADVVVKSAKSSSRIISFNCDATNPEHNDVFWDGDEDAVNDGYSPANDALFGGAVIKNMYQDWYGVPVLIENGKPMLLTMVVHKNMDNAYWDGSKMTFGDGITVFYPLTSLGVAAHEISHGFTEQHSGLMYFGQSGGLNESFSDMAAQAAEFYAYKHNSWQIGPEIFKEEDKALRYMDQPSKDCGSKKPGSRCSIDDASQYNSGLDVHYSSGVFNHAFYLIGTSEGWNTRKAFDVMVKANTDYWTSGSSFTDAACGVIKATKDYGYDVESVIKVFTDIKIDTSNC